MYLGIDLGTSAVKLCVIDAEGNLIAQGSKDLPISHPFHGASEQNCEDWWVSTLGCVDTLYVSVAEHPQHWLDQIVGRSSYFELGC